MVPAPESLQTSEGDSPRAWARVLAILPLCLRFETPSCFVLALTAGLRRGFGAQARALSLRSLGSDT